jgi:peptidyl-prolyl cis-trans isomerase SurA
MPTPIRPVPITLCFAALVSLTLGCGSSGKASSPDVWAVVDKGEIRREEVEKAYRRVAPPPPAPAPSEDEALTAKLGIVDELITQEALNARGRALNIQITDADLDKAFAEKKGNVSEEIFQQQLKERSLTVDDMKASLRREMLADKVIEQEVASKVAVSDAEITDFFNANRGQFNLPEAQYRIAQIVITPTRDPQLRNRKNDDAVTPDDATRKVQMLMARLREGARFSDLAMDYSEDPQSLQNGGDLGFVSESDLKKVPDQLRDTVLKTNPGSVSVVSAAGAHTLVLVVAKEAAGQRDLSTPGVRDQISTGLRDRKINLLRAAYITKVRNDAKIVNYLARQIVETRSAAPSLAPTAPGK